MNLSDQENPQNIADGENPTPSSEGETTLVPSNSATSPDKPEFGWSAYAERTNGRFAMIGFTALLVIEALTNNSFLHWSGLVR